MARTLFSYDPSYRAPRGGPIIDVQNGLARAGDFPLSIDGVFATQTTQAVRLWQAKSGVPQTGIVDDLAWLGLTQTQMPQLFRRCLALTAAFEGQGYTLAVGNFDGAGLTWGIIGFTLVTGDLGKVLTTINARSPAVMQAAFGDTSRNYGWEWETAPIQDRRAASPAGRAAAPAARLTAVPRPSVRRSVRATTGTAIGAAGRTRARAGAILSRWTI